MSGITPTFVNKLQTDFYDISYMLDGKYLLDKKFSCILSILSIHSFYSKNIVDSFFFYIVDSYWKLIISKNGAAQSLIIQAKYIQPVAANFATH